MRETSTERTEGKKEGPNRRKVEESGRGGAYIGYVSPAHDPGGGLCTREDADMRHSLAESRNDWLQTSRLWS
jgi:hypothetical protein